MRLIDSFSNYKLQIFGEFVTTVQCLFEFSWFGNIFSDLICNFKLCVLSSKFKKYCFTMINSMFGLLRTGISNTYLMSLQINFFKVFTS